MNSFRGLINIKEFELFIYRDCWDILGRGADEDYVEDLLSYAERRRSKVAGFIEDAFS